MAITKNFTTPQGVLTTFHEVVRVEITTSAACVSVYINCYTSEVDKLSGLNPVWQECVVVPFDGFTENPMDVFYSTCTSYADSTFSGGQLDE